MFAFDVTPLRNKNAWLRFGTQTNVLAVELNVQFYLDVHFNKKRRIAIDFDEILKLVDVFLYLLMAPSWGLSEPRAPKTHLKPLRGVKKQEKLILRACTKILRGG